MYGLLRKALFLLPPETAHSVSLNALDFAARLPGIFPSPAIETPVEVMGLSFPNRVGLAAGLDKNGDHFNALAALGFGFVEIGTITPLAQDGNPKPRLFRLPQAEAIINRMGFNNKGVDHLVAKARARKFDGVLGINIGKNLTTSVENALSDYTIAFRKVYSVADYITVNISSPNTPGLRQLQHGELLSDLILSLKREQATLADQTGRKVPLVVKIAPDLSDEELDEIANIFAHAEVEGVIATNTTSSRQGVAMLPHGGEAGGLSGAPLTSASTEIVRKLRARLPAEIPIIAAGGIMSATDAQAKLDAGAELVQIYTGFIYKGPALVRECVSALAP